MLVFTCDAMLGYASQLFYCGGCSRIRVWEELDVKVFFKSDTAVALRRGISIILCITLVSYIKVYDDYFCKLMWLSAKSPDVLEAKHY